MLLTIVAGFIVGCTMPDSQDLYRRGYDHFQAGRYREASDTLSQSEFLRNEEACLMLVECYARIGNHQKAIETYQFVRKQFMHVPPNSMLSALGDSFFLEGDDGKARKLWKIAYEQDPTFDAEKRIDLLKKKASQQKNPADSQTRR